MLAHGPEGPSADPARGGLADRGAPWGGGARTFAFPSTRSPHAEPLRTPLAARASLPGRRGGVRADGPRGRGSSGGCGDAGRRVRGPLRGEEPCALVPGACALRRPARRRALGRVGAPRRQRAHRRRRAPADRAPARRPAGPRRVRARPPAGLGPDPRRLRCPPAGRPPAGGSAPPRGSASRPATGAQGRGRRLREAAWPPSPQDPDRGDAGPAERPPGALGGVPARFRPGIGSRSPARVRADVGAGGPGALLRRGLVLEPPAPRERTHGAAPAASSATQYPDVRLARFPWERLQALQTQISG
jgi:hypothetical protein